MKLESLKVNHIKNPIGYNLSNLVFSWKVVEAKGTNTKTSRIVIKDANSVVYDSGLLEKQSGVGYSVNIDLKPRTRYTYSIEVISNLDEVATSESFFETSKMDEVWNAKWISCIKEEKRHPIFFKRFETTKKITNARLYICGLGLYEAYINCKKVGNEYLTPYSNNYNAFVQYQTYDVTEMLSTNNELSVLMGHGWYSGRFGFMHRGDKGFFGDDYKLIAELHIDYEDGSNEVVLSDDTWKVRRSNITFSSIYDGEHVDETLEELPTEDSFVCEAPKGKLVDRLSSPVTVHEIFKPIELITTPKGEKVFDLGQNFAGIFKLHINVKKGTKIHIQTGEILQGGNFYNDNLRTAKSEYFFVSNGTECDIIPHFTFYGYRYVKVEGVDNLSINDFEGLALYSELEQTGFLTTGNAKINQLISNCLWGLKSNFIDVPTDCPQRDERMGWTADTQVFTPTACLFVDAYSFYTKYLYDMASEQAQLNGLVPSVVPSCGIVNTSPIWSDATCIIPLAVYKKFGDPAILKSHYPAMKMWVDYLINYDKDGRNWGQSFNYGDWLSLDVPNQDPNGTASATDKDFLAYIYFMQSAEQVAEVARILSNEKEAEYYGNVANELRSYIKDEFYSKTGRCSINTQTAQVLTLRHKLSNNKKHTLDKLKWLLLTNNEKLNTGFVGTPFLCPTLSDNDLDKTAYRLLLNEEYPGWLYEVNLGATTIWERWNSVLEDGSISGTGMNSLNHYSYGSIAEWMFEYMCGISQEEDSVGYKNIIFRPRFKNSIKEVNGSFNSPYGNIVCNWSIIDEYHVSIHLEVPFDTKAKISLSGLENVVYNPGTYDFEYESKKSLFDYLTAHNTIKELISNPKSKQAIANISPQLIDAAGSFGEMPLDDMMLRFATMSPGVTKEMVEKQIIMLDKAIKEATVE